MKTRAPRPIPGTPSLEYRKGNTRLQRCSRCQREKELAPTLVLHVERVSLEAFKPIMVGDDLIGIVCPECVLSTERAIQSLFPDAHAWPFIDPMGQLLPTPRCECGATLAYTNDGGGMCCIQCDTERIDGPLGSDALPEDEPGQCCVTPPMDY